MAAGSRTHTDKFPGNYNELTFTIQGDPGVASAVLTDQTYCVALLTEDTVIESVAFRSLQAVGSGLTLKLVYADDAEAVGSGEDITTNITGVVANTFTNAVIDTSKNFLPAKGALFVSFADAGTNSITTISGTIRYRTCYTDR